MSHATAQHAAGAGLEVIEHGTSDTALCDALDRLLDTGVALRGDVILKVADIELIYLGLNAVLASVETIRAPSTAAFKTAARSLTTEAAP